jgi:predicted MFS family arabinose efflux permease
VRREHSIDYLGAAVVVASVTSILLYTAWAGPEQGWTSSTGLSLLVAGLVLAVVFVLVERRATEPIIPMRLFGNPIFSNASLYGFLIGVAMFGSMIFLPVYLQVVDGMSPTRSGLAMLPMVVGIFTTSIGAGQLMSRTGRYKIFPILGAGIVTVALLMLSRLGADTPYWFAALAMYVLGFGLGCTMQVIVVVVQNSVDRKDMGVATASVAFFRQMGGSFGTALFGAILTSRLAIHLTERMADAPAGAAPPGVGNPESMANDVEAINALPDQVRALVTGAFSDALSDMFLTAVPLVLLALLVAVFLKEVPLGTRQSAEAAAPQPAGPAPDAPVSRQG